MIARGWLWICRSAAALGMPVVMLLGLLMGRSGVPENQSIAQSSLTAISNAPGASSCADDVQVRLFFGLATPHGILSDADWTHFLSDEITPRFPRGLTVVQANGQWQAPGEHAVTREPSRVVEIVDAGGPAMERAIHDIVTAYRERFEQQSVMLTRGRVEVCF